MPSHPDALADATALATPKSSRVDTHAIRSEVALRLSSRLPAIEEAVLTRVFAVSEPLREDPDYVAGLRSAVAAAIDHGISALDCSAERPPPVPTALLAQARLAARMRVPLDTVLRRYFAGYTLLVDFVVTEVRRFGVEGAVLQELLRSQGMVHERVVKAVSEEYAREPHRQALSAAEQRALMVRRLLDGEPLSALSFDYEFDGYHHLALIARGEGREAAIRGLADRRGCRRLIVSGAPGVSWGWLAARQPLASADVAADAAERVRKGTLIAIGESCPGMGGWRLTHRQVRAALAIAERRGQQVVRYVDVALIAAALHDEVFAQSLTATYLEPLARDRDGGETARQTLRAYFSCGRNTSSAAAALGVNRQTVAKRLRAIDDRLGGVLGRRDNDLEVALHLDELSSDGREATLEGQPVVK